VGNGKNRYCQKMKAKGFDSTIISELTGISVEEIENSQYHHFFCIFKIPEYIFYF